MMTMSWKNIRMHITINTKNQLNWKINICFEHSQTRSQNLDQMLTLVHSYYWF